MKHFTLAILNVAVIICLNMNDLFCQAPSNDPAYFIAFEEEFNDPNGLEFDEWSQIPPWNQGSNVVQLCSGGQYVPKAYKKWKEGTEFDTTNCKIRNGSVELYTRKEHLSGKVWSWPECDTSTGITINGIPCSSPCNYDTILGKSYCLEEDSIPFEFSTSMLYSKKLFRYGYFEIKFKLPEPPTPPKRHLGFGPNFWLYNADKNGNNGWKNYASEIDIFEINSYDSLNNQSNLYTSNVHYQNCPVDSLCHKQSMAEYGHISSNVWHTAGVNWTPSKLEFYFDNTLIRELIGESLDIPFDSLISMPIWIDVNAPASNFCVAFDTINSNGTSFPYVYTINCVKVWHMEHSCSTVKNYCNFSPLLYDSKLYKSVTIGGQGCNASISNQNFVSIYATDFIELNEGVSVDANSTVVLDIQNCVDYTIDADLYQSPVPPPDSFFER